MSRYKNKNYDGVAKNPTYLKVYDFVLEYKLSHGGDSPTLRAIMEHVGSRSTSHIRYVLQKLVEYGYFEYVSFSPTYIIVNGLKITKEI